MTNRIVFVDVDDTLVRSVGSKRIPMPRVIAYVRDLHQAGCVLYLWSSGGADYARTTAQELGLLGCFSGFLPKPNLMIDDQAISDWSMCEYVHPLQLP